MRSGSQVKVSDRIVSSDIRSQGHRSRSVIGRTAEFNGTGQCHIARSEFNVTGQRSVMGRTAEVNGTGQRSAIGKRSRSRHQVAPFLPHSSLHSFTEGIPTSSVHLIHGKKINSLRCLSILYTHPSLPFYWALCHFSHNPIVPSLFYPSLLSLSSSIPVSHL